MEEQGAGDYRWRELSTLTNMLTIASAVSLILHVIRAAIFHFAPGYAAPSDMPWLSAGISFGPLLELALQVSIILCTGLGLMWLHGASVNAHILQSRMKYSPRAGVLWFFIPAVNSIMSLAVVYEIWSASGGDRKGGRLVLVWWVLAMATLYFDVFWLVGEPADLLFQIIVAGSTISFLMLARRIRALQAVGAAGVVFRDDDDIDPYETAAFSPVDINPQPSLELFESTRALPKTHVALPSNSAKGYPVDPRPGSIVVRRPKARPDSQSV